MSQLQSGSHLIVLDALSIPFSGRQMLTTCTAADDILLQSRPQEAVNSTLPARSLRTELSYLLEQGADYAAQGVAHVQSVGISQVGCACRIQA